MLDDALLKDYTSMRLGGPAKKLATASSKEELVSLLDEAEKENWPVFIIGEGSNLIANDDGFNGLIILNRMAGFEVINDNAGGAQIKVGAGEHWDEVVRRCVELGLSGVENLSAIPGTAGAAPVQNIGAYGQEVADTVLEVEAYDVETKRFVTLLNVDCDFSYRKSIFNSTAKHRYIILSLTLQLTKTTQEPPFYASLEKYLDEQQITDYSPGSLRNAVIEIRKTKLPDPNEIANTGSFFKNPILEKWQIDELQNDYDIQQIFAMGEDKYKIPAGWLIEEAGLKGFSLNGMRVYDKNALVLINESATSYQALNDIRDHIVRTVLDKFRIQLVQEPEEINT